MATSPLKHFLVGFLMPEKCYEEILVNFHVHVPCLMFVLNRIVGFWIFLDTFLAQLPQLLKILWRGSADGLSVTSALLQLYAFSCPVVYAKANNFPFFAWADRLFVLAQIAAIIFFILHYRGDTLKGLLLLSGFGAGMIMLASYAASIVITMMYSTSSMVLIASKAVQSVANYRNGHTGQLSTLSVLLTCGGSLGVVIMSLQETKGFFSSAPHILSACLSFVLLLQVLCYTSSTAVFSKKRD